MKAINDVATADEARDIAIEYSLQPADSIEEINEAYSYFEALVYKFPELREEFQENGLI